MQINLFPFIIEALGDNKRIYKDINRVYQLDKYKFYEAAKKDSLYNHQIIKEGSLIQEEYRKKILGIFLRDEKDEKLIKEIDKILKKGYRYTYTYVKNHKKIDINNYAKAFLKKYKNSQEKLGVELEQNIVILLFLSMNSLREIIRDDSYNEYMFLLNMRWEHYNNDNNTRISLDKASSEDKNNIQELKKCIYEEYGEIRNFDDLLKIEQKNKNIELSAFLFDYEKLSSVSIFDSIDFTTRDIDEILYLYVLGEKDLTNTEVATEFLITHMYIKYLIKAYKEVKEMYFENNKETMFVELEALEKALNRATEKLFLSKKDLNKATKKLETLEKENKRLKKELIEEKKSRNELNGLRKFMFNLDKKIEYKDNEKINYEKLKESKAVIVGGHNKWQQKMKEVLPNFIFINVDMLNFDINIFNNINTVFIFTNYLSHGLYYKVIEAIEGKNIKIVYINNQNQNEVLKLIQKELKLSKHVS